MEDLRAAIIPCGVNARDSTTGDGVPFVGKWGGRGEEGSWEVMSGVVEVEEGWGGIGGRLWEERSDGRKLEMGR